MAFRPGKEVHKAGQWNARSTSLLTAIENIHDFTDTNIKNEW